MYIISYIEVSQYNSVHRLVDTLIDLFNFYGAPNKLCSWIVCVLRAAHVYVWKSRLPDHFWTAKTYFSVPAPEMRSTNSKVVFRYKVIAIT